MSRGSEIAIGLMAGLVAAVLGLVAFVSGDNIPMGFFGTFVIALFFACVSAACLFETGRWLTTRISAAGIALVVVIGIILRISSGEPIVGQIGKILGLALLGVACGYYAVTGHYPDGMPMSEFFAQPSKKSKKKRRKKKRPQRRREYDYE